MRLVVKKSYEDMSKWAADYVKLRIQEFAPTAVTPFILGLPTGSTPIGTYEVSLNNSEC
jgi:glucosamine-6-phosphate deaminase